MGTDLDALFGRAVTRRDFHAAFAGMAAAAASSRLGGPRLFAARRLPENPFALGVASGDPVPDGVVLWTRLVSAEGPIPAEPVNVDWQVTTDAALTQVIRSGTTTALPGLAHSVHVAVTGLAAGREYFYRFRAAGEDSPVGRTRTAPDGKCERLALAFASCQKRTANGRYASYAGLLDENVHAVVFLGDYIYESPNTETIGDYRALYALYKASPDLQAVHAAYPFVVTFDDHEVENNFAGYGSARSGADPMILRRRRAAAYRAYYEHMPLPTAALPNGSRMRTHRRLHFGDLARLHMLDTRGHRSPAPCSPETTAECAGRADPDRTILGLDQERWLARGFGTSPTRWDLLGNTVMMANFNHGTSAEPRYSSDTWAAFPVARDRLLRQLRDRRVRNPIVFTGDAHANYALDLDLGPGETIAPEFVGTSISSPAKGQLLKEAQLATNPHCRFYGGDRRGYLLCDLTHRRATMTMRTVLDPAVPTLKPITQAAFEIPDGDHYPQRVA